MDAVERNIETVRRLDDAFNRRDYVILGGLIAEGFDAHNPGSNDVTVEGLRANNEDWYAAFPDKRTDIVDVFGEGDRVVARIRDLGTNTGGVPWFGIPANGRAMDIEWIEISRHDRDGRIVEMWAQAEVLKLLRQLGAVPAPREVTPDELRAISRRFVEEVFNERSLKHAQEMLAQDVVEHSPPLSDTPTGKSGAIQALKLFRGASEDVRVEILDHIADGRRVAIRARYTGTDTGGLFPGMPATGRRFEIEGIDVAVADDEGKVIEHHAIADVKLAMQQLGLAPSAMLG